MCTVDHASGPPLCQIALGACQAASLLAKPFRYEALKYRQVTRLTPPSISRASACSASHESGHHVQMSTYFQGVEVAK